MSSHFSCIGFPVQNMDDYWALARRAAAEGIRLASPDGGALVRWTAGPLQPDSPRRGSGQAARGPEIWAQVNGAGEVIGATPFFSTGMTHRIAVTGVGEDPDEPMDGWIDGWLEPAADDEPFSGAFPLRVSLADFAIARNRFTTFPSVHRIEIAALAHEADHYADVAAYAAVPGEIYRMPVPSLLSAAHASIDEPPAFQEAAALVAGFIQEVRLLTNAVTEATFWWIQLVIQSVRLDVFADREVLGGEPRPGEILSASVWLVGRVI